KDIVSLKIDPELLPLVPVCFLYFIKISKYATRHFYRPAASKTIRTDRPALCREVVEQIQRSPGGYGAGINGSKTRLSRSRNRVWKRTAEFKDGAPASRRNNNRH